MIGYAIWDQTSLITNRFLRRYIRDTFYEIQLDFGHDIPVHHDMDHLLDLCRDVNHLVVFQSGHVSRSPRRFAQAVADFCGQDFLVAGQIIHHVNTYPFLHPQMFILNMDRYKAIGSPPVGYHEDSDVLHLHKPLRSETNVHDDYTPLWLKPTGEVIPCVRRDFGWNIIHESLNQGLPVLNLPASIRYAKRFIYPNDRPHMFAACLEQLAQDQLHAIPTKLNPNQQAFLAELLTPGIACQVNLFNTEKLIDARLDTLVENSFAPQRLFGLASGFKLFVLWTRFPNRPEVMYYDHNRESLRIWKHIVENWSGRAFPEFCKQHGYNDDFSKMQSVIDAVGGEDELEKLWKEFQASRPRFIWCDVMRHPQNLLDEMVSTGNCVWYSNCFSFFEGIRRYGSKGTLDRERRFLEALTSKDANTVCLSTTQTGYAKDLLKIE